jgi:3-dehydroquinate synthase
MSTIASTSYEILINEEYHILNTYIDKLSPSKIIIIVDENTEEHCLPKIKKNIHHDFLSIKIPSGEKYKTLSTCQGLWQALIQNDCDRETLIINLGGGVIGDMGGFVAGTYMRGVKFIQIPTTLLAQVDASVGGKLAIDHMAYKNIIGLFLEPTMVWVDTSFLDTLPDAHVRSGYAEVVKHALIRSKALWNKISDKDIFHNSSSQWASLVEDNINIKNYVVQQDFKEGGLRKVLNFGHTVGHAVESYFLDSSTPLLHGEAIAIGMICEAYISTHQNKLSNSELTTITNYIKSIYPKQVLLNPIREELLRLMTHDKKNISGQYLFALLDGIGKSSFDNDISKEIIGESLQYYDEQFSS